MDGDRWTCVHYHTQRGLGRKLVGLLLQGVRTHFMMCQSNDGKLLYSKALSFNFIKIGINVKQFTTSLNGKECISIESENGHRLKMGTGSLELRSHGCGDKLRRDI